eukprot:gb/GECH01000242.1/.p1 GENE.gb/GECH01000242.1/~~gb/GECH01000242.1/.p1  ORF type:complete len:1056 (+),score=222.82 gb/GECH01000242.1/:1-3168(+)
MEEILDFSSPLNVETFDKVVYTFYNSNDSEERSMADRILTEFQKHPDSWTRVDKILEQSNLMQSKFLALQILEQLVRYRWNILPSDQAEGIKGYVIRNIISLSEDSQTLSGQRVFIGKLNLILVQILKQEWPHNWPNFVPDIVDSSKSNESLCENNMSILRLLSEEIFDFSSGQMTQAKIDELKQSLHNEFSQIHLLCEFILKNGEKPSLLSETLKTMLRFLSWIPLGYIFETNLIELLATKFLPEPQYRNDTIRCLTEIASISIGDQYYGQINELFLYFMRVLTEQLPTGTNIPSAFDEGDQDDEDFVSSVCLFLCSVFKSHLSLLENNREAVLRAHQYLIEISQVDDIEIFKACLDYWNFLTRDIYLSEKKKQNGPLALQHSQNSRSSMYGEIFSQLRLVLISRMAKPEEIIIVEDDNGQLVKQNLKDVDALQQYKTMRETLIYLTHLDPLDTENTMLSKLDRQINGTEWSWHNLNTLCWAIGSISGAMSEREEKSFLVKVIKDLLGLVEVKKGKNHKAVIASNIMYVVGQYPRFLKAHWNFLRTVVNKLFEFMHESFEGVQEMACDTFLKIAKKCRKKFITTQPRDSSPFIEYRIISDLPEIICDLEPQHIQVFYEAVGWILSAATQNVEDYLSKIMNLPNSRWSQIMRDADTNVDRLREPVVMKDLSNVLKTNIAVAKSLKQPYFYQIKLIYSEMLEVYKAYSQMISQEVTANGSVATKYSNVRGMRAVKRDTLRLVETFIEHSENPQFISQHFIPPLLEAVLGDYYNSDPNARDPGVLSVIAAAIRKLRGSMHPHITRILESVMETTLPMITENFEDYPEHRINFFKLLRQMNKHCFEALSSVDDNVFKLIVDSIIWAVKHTEKNISETGLHVLYELLQHVSNLNTQHSGPFYQAFFLSILQDVFYVLTDTLHKACFKNQAAILSHMIELVASNQLSVSLFDPSQYPENTTNQSFLCGYLTDMLASSFTNLSRGEIEQFVMGLFEKAGNLNQFQDHLRDFLVKIKEFSKAAEALAEEERQQEKQRQQRDLENQVPGLRTADQDNEDGMGE